MTTAVVSPFVNFSEVIKKNNKINYNNNILSSTHQMSCTNPPVIPPSGNLLDRKAVGTPSAGGMFQRRHSVTIPSCKFNQNQLINSLKMDSSPTFSTNSNNKENRFRDRSYSETGERHLQKSLSVSGTGTGSQVNSSRYKTELCRPYEENGSCKYGDKCQFAHGIRELRSLNRHPKYKTELCRTFHTIGFCPYGPRCHFIHNAEERRRAVPAAATKVERPRLQHSYSFAGFSSAGGQQDSPTSVTPPPIFSTKDLAAWTTNPLMYSSQELASVFGPSLGGSLAGDLSTQTPHSPTTPYFRPMSESPPMFESPSSPPDSLSDQEGYQSSSGSLSGSESPVLDATRRLPIFSRLSISDD